MVRQFEKKGSDGIMRACHGRDYEGYQVDIVYNPEITKMCVSTFLKPTFSKRR
jgi:hypothetical protein